VPGSVLAIVNVVFVEELRPRNGTVRKFAKSLPNDALIVPEAPVNEVDAEALMKSTVILLTMTSRVDGRSAKRLANVNPLVVVTLPETAETTETADVCMAAPPRPFDFDLDFLDFPFFREGIFKVRFKMENNSTYIVSLFQITCPYLSRRGTTPIIPQSQDGNTGILMNVSRCGAHQLQVAGICDNTLIIST